MTHRIFEVFSKKLYKMLDDMKKGGFVHGAISASTIYVDNFHDEELLDLKLMVVEDGGKFFHVASYEMNRTCKVDDCYSYSNFNLSTLLLTLFI